MSTFVFATKESVILTPDSFDRTTLLYPFVWAAASSSAGWWFGDGRGRRVTYELAFGVVGACVGVSAPHLVLAFASGSGADWAKVAVCALSAVVGLYGSFRVLDELERRQQGKRADSEAAWAISLACLMDSHS